MACAKDITLDALSEVTGSLAKARQALARGLPAEALPEAIAALGDSVRADRTPRARDAGKTRVESALLVAECGIWLEYPEVAEAALCEGMEILSGLGSTNEARRLGLQARLLWAALAIERASLSITHDQRPPLELGGAEGVESTRVAAERVEEDVQQALRDAETLAQKELMATAAGWLLLLQGRWSLRRRDAEQAVDLLQRACHQLREHPGEPVSIQAHLELARALRADAQMAPAANHLRQARELAVRLDHCHLLGSIHLEAGELGAEPRLSVGVAEQQVWPWAVPAATHLAQARAFYRRGGTLAQVQRVQRRLEAAGRRATDRVMDPALERRASRMDERLADLDGHQAHQWARLTRWCLATPGTEGAREAGQFLVSHEVAALREAQQHVVRLHDEHLQLLQEVKGVAVQRDRWRALTRAQAVALEAVAEGVVTLGTGGVVLAINGRGAQFLGRPAEELVGRTLAEVPGIPDPSVELLGAGDPQGALLQLPGGKAWCRVTTVRDEPDSEACRVITLTESTKAQGSASRRSDPQIEHRVRYTFDAIIGAAPAFVAQIELARRMAGAEVPLLITGESGTGKEVLAQAMHHASPRAAGPFVGINCGAIPAELMESELFGYEEGAFTGARRGGQHGKLEVARGGTVLLDEIGDLPLLLQAKLLRVLEERRYQRIGGTALLSLDARIIATTNRDIEALVDDGRFRLDLLYRLQGTRIHLPPLRERLDDLPLLSEHFLERAAAQVGRRLARMAPGVLDALRAYHWPGNIRQLRTVIEQEVHLAPPELEELESLHRALEWRATATGAYPRPQVVAVPPLPDVPLPGTATFKVPGGGGVDEPGGFRQYREAAEQAEVEVILAALRNHAGSVRAAATWLGLSRSTLYSMLRRYDIDVAEYRLSSGEQPALGYSFPSGEYPAHAERSPPGDPPASGPHRPDRRR
jgi:transcriptional regulator with PAS, ATPase and Fis domain